MYIMFQLLSIQLGSSQDALKLVLESHQRLVLRLFCAVMYYRDTWSQLSFNVISVAELLQFLSLHIFHLFFIAPLLLPFLFFVLVFLAHCVCIEYPLAFF